MIKLKIWVMTLTIESIIDWISMYPGLNLKNIRFSEGIPQGT